MTRPSGCKGFNVSPLTTFKLLVATLALPILVACGDQPVPEAQDYAATDALVEQMRAAIAADPDLSLVADIDHSRLGVEAGSPMAPSRVLIFSDPLLESQLLQVAPLVGLDLPLRVLAYDDVGSSRVIYNRFAYLASRFAPELAQVASLGARYDAALGRVTEGFAADTIAGFDDDTMQPDGIVTLDSPYDFATTLEKVNRAIEAQDDTVFFGNVDFQANARKLGIEIAPAHMILFGGPGPGGRAMADAPTLGLDAFCQKFLVWEDAQGKVHLSFNDLLALAERQQVKVAPALRVINLRLRKVFTEALQ